MATRTLATYVGDMHALESHVMEPFQTQLGLTKDVPSAHNVVEQLVATCRIHVPMLEERMKAFDHAEKFLTERIKTVVSELFGYAAGLIDLVRPLAASKALRDSYTAIHMLIVGYMMLNTTAIALNDTVTQELAERCLADWTRNAQLVMGVIPYLALKDLRDDNVPIVHADADLKVMDKTKDYAGLFISSQPTTSK